MEKTISKTGILFILLMLGFITATAKAKLVASYTFDDSTAKDSSGNRHDGILGGEASFYNDPEKGSVFQVKDMPGTYIDCGGKSLENDSTWAGIKDKMTLAAWVKGESKEAESRDDFNIISKGSFFKFFIGRSSKINLENIDLNKKVLRSKNAIDSGKWHHLVAVYDGACRYIYIDGILDTSDNVVGTLSAGTASIIIGNDIYQKNRICSGLIDDVLVFDHALNQTEILNLFCLSPNSLAPKPLQNLVKLEKQVATLSDKQEFKKIVSILEKELKFYEKPNDVNQKILLSNLYFELANAREKSSEPKDKIIEEYKKVISFNEVVSPKTGQALLYLWKNLDTNEYKKIASPCILHAEYLNEIAITAKDMMDKSDSEKTGLKEASDFLQINLAILANWKQINPFVKIESIESAASPLYFQLARAKLAIGTKKEEVAGLYRKMFENAPMFTNPIYTQALLWLFENEFIDDCINITHLYAKSLLSKINI